MKDLRHLRDQTISLDLRWVASYGIFRPIGLIDSPLPNPDISRAQMILHSGRPEEKDTIQNIYAQAF